MQDINPNDNLSELLKSTILELGESYLLEKGEWEVTLWRLIEQGLVSHSKYTNRLGDDSGISRDQVIGLRRLASAAGGWVWEGEFINLADWLDIYRSKLG